MSSLVSNVPIYLLSSIAMLGAFSRFTHGVYTPQFYAFQEYHMPDDGSTTAKITPIMDTILGLTLLLGSRPFRLVAASLSMLFMGLGLVLQIQTGKEFIADVGMVVLATLSVVSLLRR